MRTHFYRFVYITAFVCLALQGATAHAVPSTAQPEIIERQLQIQTPRPEVGGAPLITAPNEGVKIAGGGASFELKAIEFEDLSAFTADDIKPLYKDKLDTRITLSELSAIAAKITAFYRNHGYILSRAIVPPQKIEHGVAKIRIVAGYVSDVQVQGPGSDDALVQHYVEKIKASRPLDSKMLERYLLLINDLPGVTARAVLQPSPTTPGASEVVITLERKHIEGSLSLDNRGTRFIGPVQGGATIGGDNLLGLDEQTQLHVVNTVFDPSELKYGEIRHEEQIGSEGTKLMFSANYVHTDPGYTLDPLNVFGTTTEYMAGVRHPLLRSRQSNWFVSSDFSIQRVDAESLGANVYEDNLKVLRVGTAYDFLDSWSAVNRLESNISQGFKWDTGNDGLFHSRSSGKADFTKIDAKITRQQPLSGPFSAYLAVTGQYSDAPLYAAQEMALGGPEFGSAYDPAEITGDSGVAGRIELQYNKTRQAQFLSTYQLYGFYDIGEVWNRNIIAASEAKDASLASAGLGARFNLLDPLSGSVEVAMPLTRNVAAFGDDGNMPRVFFNLLYRY